jgi:hypothetical protein
MNSVPETRKVPCSYALRVQPQFTASPAAADEDGEAQEDVMEKKPKTDRKHDRFAETTRATRRKKLAPKFMKGLEIFRQATIEDAFYYDDADNVDDVMKGTLAVAYLLESASCVGCEKVDGRIAQGLAYALRYYASNVGKYLKPIAPYAAAED